MSHNETMISFETESSAVWPRILVGGAVFGAGVITLVIATCIMAWIAVSYGPTEPRGIKGGLFMMILGGMGAFWGAHYAFSRAIRVGAVTPFDYDKIKLFSAMLLVVPYLLFVGLIRMSGLTINELSVTALILDISLGVWTIFFAFKFRKEKGVWAFRFGLWGILLLTMFTVITIVLFSAGGRLFSA
jgi:hypothetical protein